MAKIRVEIPLRNRNSGGGEGDTTQVTLASFQGIKTLYFEAVVSNSSGAPQYLYLKNASETQTYATLTVPNGTGVTQYLSVLGTMFTLNQVDLKITGTVTSLRTARCIIVMDIGSDPLIHYPYYMYMGGYASTTSTLFVRSGTPFFFKYSPANYNNVNKAVISFYGYIENLKSYGYAFIYWTSNFLSHTSIDGTSVSSEAINKTITSFDLSPYGDYYFVIFLSTGNNMYPTVLYSAYGYAVFSSTAAFTNYVLPHNQSSSGLSIADGGYESVGVSLITTKATSLKTIAVRMRSFGSPTDSVQLKVILGNSPETGTLIETSQTISGSSIPTTSTYPEYVIFTFSSPISISASTTYCVIMERTEYDPYGSAYEWFTTSKVGSEDGKIFNGTTWGTTTAIPIIVFGPDGIDKFEGQYMLGNQTAGIPVEYESDYWDGVTNSYYFSYDDQLNPSTAQLLDGSDNVIPNTTLSSTSATEQNTATTPFTMVPDESLIKTSVTGGPMVGSRILYISELISGSSTIKILSGLLAIGASTRRGIWKTVTGATLSAALFIRQIVRRISGVVDTLGTSQKRTSRLVTVFMSAAALVNRFKVILRELLSSISAFPENMKNSMKRATAYLNSVAASPRWINSIRTSSGKIGSGITKITQRQFNKLLDAAADVKRHIIKVQGNSITLVGTVRRDSLKIILAAANQAISLARLSSKRLEKIVSVLGSLIYDFVQGLIEKLLTTEIILVTASVRRSAMKALSKVTTFSSSLSRVTLTVILGAVSLTGSFLKTSTKSMVNLINTGDLTTRVIAKRILLAVENSAILEKIKVVLRDVTAVIAASSSIKKAVSRGTMNIIKSAATASRLTQRRLQSELTVISQKVKISTKSIMGHNWMMASLLRMRVSLKTLAAITVSTDHLARSISKGMSTVIQLIGMVRRRTVKFILGAIYGIHSVQKAIRSKINNDLSAISSTFRFSFRELSINLRAATTGFSAWKVVQTLYLKTVAASSLISIRTNRATDRIFLSISKIVGLKFVARSTTGKSERNLMLSTAGRTLNLEIRSQEGNVITMAYTGDTIRLYGRFYNWGGELADVTGQVIHIYDGKGSLIITGTPVKESTGVYQFEYPIPSDFSDPLVYEMSGTLEGSVILARSTIVRRWV